MKLFTVAAAIEIGAGLFLIVSPTLLARLILNADLNDAGQAVGRLGGFGLFGLGLASWPGSSPISTKGAASRGLLAYNVLAAILFIYLGVRGTLVGPLLWPVAVLHSALAILLARMFMTND